MAEPNRRSAAVPNDLEAFWVPFTPNRAFKRAPRLIARAKDMHYYTPEGRAVLDGTAGLWCTNAGHNREPIVAAISIRQPTQQLSIQCLALVSPEEGASSPATTVWQMMPFGAAAAAAALAAPKLAIKLDSAIA